MSELRILFLGGSGFIGPHYVHAALERGHKVAVFNRSKTSVSFPSSVERLIGDRSSDLKAIQDRDWDAVIDLATYVPSWVRTLGQALRDRVAHYTFISTTSVYADPEGEEWTDESSKLRGYRGDDDPFQITNCGDHYGALKVLCEQEAERQFSGRTLILRPGIIVGPGEFNQAFTYWPVRLEKGGEALVAGDAAHAVQFIDARDLAEWTIRLIEKSFTGTYNVAGPQKTLALGELVAAAGACVATSAKLVWAPSSLLLASGRPMWPLVFWSTDWSGSKINMRIDAAKAFAAGMTARPVEATLRDTLAWYRLQSPEIQSAVATGAIQKKGEAGWELALTPWTIYLEWEKEIIVSRRRRSNSSTPG